MLLRAHTCCCCCRRPVFAVRCACPASQEPPRSATLTAVSGLRQDPCCPPCSHAGAASAAT
eukprot:12208733-Alexandrium_andersonii.AAC.1